MVDATKITTSLTIDWLSITHRTTPDGEGKSPEAMLAYATACAPLDRQKSARVKAMNGYKNAIKYDDGTIVQWHAGRPEMGTQYLYTGETLTNYDGFDLMVNHVNGGGRARRLDITMDTNSPIHIYKLKRLADAKKWKSRCRTPARYLREKGETLYIGAKTSDEMVRIYDKRAERGLSDDSPIWNRIEMKLMDDKAENVARVLAMEGRDAIPSIILGYVDFPSHSAWKLAFQRVEGMVLPDGEKRISDTKEWLLTQVASALTKVAEMDRGFIQDFVNELYFRGAWVEVDQWVDEG